MWLLRPPRRSLDRSMDASRARELVDYNPETGSFTWRVSRQCRRAGSPAGSTVHRYVLLKLDGKLYPAHRVAWLITYGQWPAVGLDHINGDPHDNRIANLRECNQSENSQNRRKSAANKSGYTGVSWHAASNKWRSQIKINGRTHECGMYLTPQMAHLAYRYWKHRLHTFNPTVRAA